MTDYNSGNSFYQHCATVVWTTTLWSVISSLCSFWHIPETPLWSQIQQNHFSESTPGSLMEKPATFPVYPADAPWSPEIHTVKEEPCCEGFWHPPFLLIYRIPSDFRGWKEIGKHRGDCCVLKLHQCSEAVIVVPFFLPGLFSSASVPPQRKAFQVNSVTRTCTCRMHLSVTISIILCICRLTQGFIVTF